MFLIMIYQDIINIYIFSNINIYLNLLFRVNLANAGKEIKYALKERTITIGSQEGNLLFIRGYFYPYYHLASGFI